MRGEIVVAVLAGALLGGMLGSCTRGDPGPSITRVAEGTPDAAAPSGTIENTTVDATPAADARDATTTGSVALPPLDLKCTVDADCGYVAVTVSGPLTCCASCGTTIGSTTWVAAVKTICASGMIVSSLCPALDCPMGPMHARCDVGRCVPKW